MTTIVREFTVSPSRGAREEPLTEALQKTLEEYFGCGPTPPNDESQTTVLCIAQDHPLGRYDEEGCVFVGNVARVLINALPSHQGEPTV